MITVFSMIVIFLKTVTVISGQDSQPVGGHRGQGVKVATLPGRGWAVRHHTGGMLVCSSCSEGTPKARLKMVYLLYSLAWKVPKVVVRDTKV